MKLNCPFCNNNISGVCVVLKKFVNTIDTDRNCPGFSMTEFQRLRRAQIIRRAIIWTVILLLTFASTIVILH